MKKTNQKVNLTNNEKFYHYFILLFLAVLPVMSIYFLIQNHLGLYSGPRKPENFYTIGGIGTLLITLFYALQNRRLKFNVIHKVVDYKDIEIAVKQCSFELDWDIILKTKNKIIATRKNNFAWGERITIIIEQDKVLINSICDPNKMTAITSYGRNRENVECFRKRINEMPS